MSGIVNVTLKIDGIVDGRYIKAEDGFETFTYTISGNVLSMGNVSVTAASGGQQIAGFSAAPTFLYVVPDVAGILAWSSATAANNGSLVCAAGKPVLFSAGQTTVDAATPELRSEASAEDISVLWYDCSSNGEVFVLALR